MINTFKTTRRVLIVSPYFPPSTLAGVHRARILAKYLPKHGWQAVVVCVDEAYHEQRLDPELAGLVPPDVKVVKAPAWPARWCRLAGLGDVGIRGYFQMKKAVARMIEKEGADLLLITVLPGFPMIMGGSLKKRHNIPFVLDYQDPWVSQWGAKQPVLSKAGLAYRLAKWLEPQAVRSADRITSVSEGTNALIRNLYPDLPLERFHAIPIGVDPDDFSLLRSTPRSCPWLEKGTNLINLCYVGNIWPGVKRTLHGFLTACVRLKDVEPDLFQRLKVTFVGTSNQPDGFKDYKVLPMARRMGLESKVCEVPERVAYLDALNILLKSDFILMLGSDDPYYTASKLYPCLMANRPVFAVFHEKSSVCGIARKTGGVFLVTYGEGNPVEQKIEEIRDGLARTVQYPNIVPPLRPAELDLYMGENIAGAFSKVFDEALACARG